MPNHLGGEGFFAHYDGIFMFKDENGADRKGWYEYTDNFVNVLVALDPCNKENGTIEIAKVHNGSFENLLLNTKQNGTPEILDKIKTKINFYTIELNTGDIVIFNNLCPHKSEKNNSKQNRGTLYYTYTQEKHGSFYEKHFIDKKNSKNNKSKSLSK
jgi:ectoine hydroxylase-related dioxygenase (phytanoyl-CoA dioxygenase family)